MKFTASAISAIMLSVKAVDCPAFPVKQDISIPDYLGEWYEISRDEWTAFEWFAECVTAHYTPRTDNSVGVQNRQWSWWTFFSYYALDGYAQCPTDEGACMVNFNGKNNKEPNYNVLLTDYTSYSIVYSCNDGLWLGEYLWVLSREPTMDADLYESLKNQVAEIIPWYNWDRQQMTVHDDTCEYEWNTSTK